MPIRIISLPAFSKQHLFSVAKPRYNVPMNTKLNTPCVGICSTVYGDDVCRGCKRISQEIIDWNTYDGIQKKAVFDRLASLITEVMQYKIDVVDAALLRQQLDFLGIRYRDDQPPYCDVYYLLRAGASQIADPADFGFRVYAHYQEYSLPELFKLMEEEYLTTAQERFKSRFVATKPLAPQ